LVEVALVVLAVRRPHPVRVAIDGCSAAGKTTLADELAAVVAERTHREVVRVGIDYFKRAVELRTAFPPDSAERADLVIDNRDPASPASATEGSPPGGPG
jgi:uridine kinase